MFFRSQLAMRLVVFIGLFFFVSPSFAATTYLDILPLFWSSVYPNGGKTLYCGEEFSRYDKRVNVEHVFPMSWVTKELACGDRHRCRRNSDEFNRIESDMHNLFPARKDMNKLRGAYAYSILKGERRVERQCDFEVNHRSRRVEPRPEVRGDIARAMLYMSDRYGLALYKRQKALLVKWNLEDLPDAGEKERNALIGELQGNRNPYIDDYGRVDGEMIE